MNRILYSLAALLLMGCALEAQPPAAPAHPAPKPPRPAFIEDDQLLQTGGFEMPRVTKRTPREAGGNIVTFGQGEWARFGPNTAASDGQVAGGLTNEAARTGKQSVYVEFNHSKGNSAAYELTTSLLPVKPSEKYHVSIWGRIDAKNPLVADQRQPQMLLHADFFQADGETQVGDTSMHVQPIPGDPARQLFFTEDRWTEYYADVDSPVEAAFLRVSWMLTTTGEPGETNGVIYLDDAGINGPRVEAPPEPLPPELAPPGTVPMPAAPPATPAPAPRVRPTAEPLPPELTPPPASAPAPAPTPAAPEPAASK